jgi:hypothetical protein
LEEASRNGFESEFDGGLPDVHRDCLCARGSYKCRHIRLFSCLPDKLDGLAGSSSLEDVPGLIPGDADEWVGSLHGLVGLEYVDYEPPNLLKHLSIERASLLRGKACIPLCPVVRKTPNRTNMSALETIWFVRGHGESFDA